MLKIILSFICLAVFFSCNSPAPIVNNYYTAEGDSNALVIYIGEMDSGRCIVHQDGIYYYPLFDLSGFGNIYECQVRRTRIDLVDTQIIKTFDKTAWELATDYYIDSVRYILGEPGDSFKIAAW